MSLVVITGHPYLKLKSPVLGAWSPKVLHQTVYYLLILCCCRLKKDEVAKDVNAVDFCPFEADSWMAYFQHSHVVSFSKSSLVQMALAFLRYSCPNTLTQHSTPRWFVRAAPKHPCNIVSIWFPSAIQLSYYIPNTCPLCVVVVPAIFSLGQHTINRTSLVLPFMRGPSLPHLLHLCWVMLSPYALITRTSILIVCFSSTEISFLEITSSPWIQLLSFASAAHGFCPNTFSLLAKSTSQTISQARRRMLVYCPPFFLEIITILFPSRCCLCPFFFSLIITVNYATVRVLSAGLP